LCYKVNFMSNRFAYVIGLGFWILLTFAIAAFASQFEPDEWYTIINKPSWTPPGWLFGPVWGILYLLMSISAWLIWNQRNVHNVKLPLILYTIQLIINGLWSYIFFEQHKIGIALIDVLLLAALISMIIFRFRQISKIAGILFIPYLLWVCFATALNFEIWRIN
jgi:translocator protein